MNKPANLYVVAAPSGGGKTSLVAALLRLDQKLRLSVSHTTRPPRPGEVDGQHYYFVSEQEFSRLVAENAFLEHAQVYDHRYGTGREQVQRQLDQGFDVMLDIDWQGAAQIRRSFPDCRSIFILPPSLEELHRRLSLRGQDSAEVIERRMQKARSELSHAHEFDYMIVNDDFDAALHDLHAIIRSGSHRRPGQGLRTETLLAQMLENA
ncbi:MAG TPA: guanylate kinase [Xanthomonadales bacterium]|nr:guanylate kinase [Xanthomonadales bacterium]